MLAIWGAINLAGNPIDKEKQILLRQAFDKCVIDRYEELTDSQVNIIKLGGHILNF